MTLKIEKRDITTVTGLAIVMHGVNCQGKMASGVAKAIAEKWPVVRAEYLALEEQERELGKVQFIAVSPDLTVANCFTQEYYGYDGRQYAKGSAIATCLIHVSVWASAHGITRIYLPKIGCGLGGLRWEEVRPIIEGIGRGFSNLEFIICEI